MRVNPLARTLIALGLLILVPVVLPNYWIFLATSILISSIISVPLDSLAFLYLSGYLAPLSFTTETLSKAVGVAIVWMLLKLRADRKLAGAA